MTFHGNKGDPGECNECCEECVIVEDTGKGADSTDITPPWDEIEGDSERLSDKLRLPGPARIILQTPHPSGDTGNQAVFGCFEIDALSSGLARPRVVVAYTDDDNYVAAEFYYDDAGCSSLRMYQVLGGTETEIQDQQALPEATLTGEYWFQVCWEPHGLSSSGSGSGDSSDPGVLRARVKLPTGQVYGSQAYVYTRGESVGLDSRAGTVLFSHIKFDHEALDEGFEDCTNCNTPCPISSDDFSNAALSACKWNSGTLVSIGEFTTTSKTKHLVFHPQLLPNMEASATFQDGANKTAKIFINDDDAGNYLLAEYASTANTYRLRIYRNGALQDENRISGVVSFPATATLHVCYNGSVLSAEIKSACTNAIVDPIEDGKWSHLEGDVTWTNYELGKAKSASDLDCEKCGCNKIVVCTHCLFDEKPTYILVEMPVMANGICSECGDIPNFILLNFGTIGGSCIWNGGWNCSCSGNDSLHSLSLSKPGINYILTFRYGCFGPPAAGSGNGIDFQVNLGPNKPNCMEWDQLLLPFLDCLDNVGFENCDATGTSAKITALI